MRHLQFFFAIASLAAFYSLFRLRWVREPGDASGRVVLRHGAERIARAFVDLAHTIGIRCVVKPLLGALRRVFERLRGRACAIERAVPPIYSAASDLVSACLSLCWPNMARRAAAFRGLRNKPQSLKRTIRWTSAE